MTMLLTGQIFANRYLLKKLIGVGGYSQVWLAGDTRAGNMEVAIKIYAPEKGLDSDGIETFGKEFTLVFNLNHAHLLRPMHYDVKDNSPYLVMQFCPNGSLLKKVGEINEKELAVFMQQASSALAYLHRQDPPIIHQDIKPDNFLIDIEGNYLLADFGISSKIRRTLTKSMGARVSTGTLAYMPPEKFSEDKQIIKAGDIFSLGVTMYEMLTGDLPFGDNGGLTLKAGADVPRLPSGYSQELSMLLKSCMAKEPWERPTAEQLEETATKFLQSSQWPVVGSPVPNPVPEPPREPEQPRAGRKTQFIPNDGFYNYTEEINGVRIEMVAVAGGTFNMGSNEFEDEMPVHEVTVSDFYLGKTPVTQAQWRAIMDSNPAHFAGDNLPIENVNWNDVQTFLKKINQLFGKRFRLPTEAEWEYAAGGGAENRTKWSGANNPNVLGDFVWYDGNSSRSFWKSGKPQPVATKKSNCLELFDMSGNVWELCQDYYGSYNSSSQDNPQGPSSGSNRVSRGGSWSNQLSNCRVSGRYGGEDPSLRRDNLGFRLAISI